MRVAVVVIVMWVSALRPTSQHVTEHGDRATQLDLTVSSVVADLAAAPGDAIALPALSTISVHRSCAAVATVATCHFVTDTFVSSELARGPPV